MGKIPVKGYKNITVKEEIYRKLEILAIDDHRSVSREVEFLVLNADKNRRKAQKKAAEDIQCGA